jgi:hypothetical protein
MAYLYSIDNIEKNIYLLINEVWLSIRKREFWPPKNKNPTQVIKIIETKHVICENQSIMHQARSPGVARGGSAPTQLSCFAPLS